MKKLFIANWKCNPDSTKDAVRLARDIEKGIAHPVRNQISNGASKNATVVIAPPFPFLDAVRGAVKKIKLGAQDAWWESGPYTGAVSWKQLKDRGVSCTIIGHSERRRYGGETDEAVNRKVCALLAHGMTPILCVGETKRNGDSIPEIVGMQVRAALRGVKKAHLKNLVVAYEPVWAISTNRGEADTPDNAFRARIYIRKMIAEQFGVAGADAVRIIYGGSVNARNISAFLHEGKMDGALVGHASLNAEEFVKIVTSE